MRILKIAAAVMLITGMSCFQAVAAGLKVTEMAVTTKIVKGNPIDSVHRISSASVKQLFCFTRTTDETDETTQIKHVWYKNNEKVGEYELPIKGKHWRTYSKRQVEKGKSAGDWRVDAIDSDGNVLKSVTFRMN